MRTLGAAAIAILVLLPSAALADSARSAALVCAVSAQAGGPCTFSTAKRRVYVALNIPKNEAKTTCFGILVSLMKQRISFPDGRWALEIRSPSGAMLFRCPLPN